jgi:Outer membrane protein
MADRALEIAKTERTRMNSFWYPQLNASGVYTHLSNDVEARMPMKDLTEPAQKIISQLLPGDNIISGLLSEISTRTLAFPLMDDNLTTIDANLIWPVFTGRKRIYASKIGNRMVDLARISRNETASTLQTELVESYFGLRLAIRVTDVRRETYNTLKTHYENALKLEQNGMINKAEKLFAKVSMDEAWRELQSARKQQEVAQAELRSVLNFDSTTILNPVTPLFINKTLPSKEYFKNMLPNSNYTINKLYIEEKMARNQTLISKSSYMPVVSIVGKQTLYSHNVPRYLVPRTMVGVALTWNIFDGFNREASVRQSKLSENVLALGREKAKDEVSVLVDDLYSKIEDAVDNVAMLNTTLEMTRELLRVRKKSFQEGMATSTEVIDAENLCSQIEVAYLMAYFQYDIALSSLLSVCGISGSFWKYSNEGEREDFIFNDK